MKQIREIQEKLLAFAQYVNEWNNEILEEKKKNNEGVSDFPVLSDSFFAELPSHSMKVPHITRINDAKPASSLTKKIQPEFGKIPIISKEKGKQQTVQPPTQIKALQNE